MSDDKLLENLSFDTMKFCTHQIEENDADPIAVAAILMAHSLSLYRSFLDEESYESILQTIFEQRNKISQKSSRIYH